MAAIEPEGKPPLSVEEISRGALAIAAERDLVAMASRFFALVQSWAAPSVTLCVEKDASVENGWRLVPELTSGPVPAGFERSFAKFIAESLSGSLDRPTLIRPSDELSTLHVKLLDSWIVPWSNGTSSGFLLLRGIPRPYPPNLGDGVALVSQPLWPRLGRQTPLPELIDQLERAAERLAAEMRAERERLQAGGMRTAAPEGKEARELREKVESVDRARAEIEAERDKGLAEVAKMQARLDSLEGEATGARRQLSALQAKAEALEKARAEADKERESAEAEAADLRDQVERLERSLEGDRHALEESRSAARGVETEAADLRDQVERLERSLEGDRHALEESRSAARGVETAAAERLAEREEARRQLAQLLEKIDALEKERAGAEVERARAKTEANQLWSSIESLQKQNRTDKERFEAEKVTLEKSRQVREREAEEATAHKVAAEHARDEARAAVAEAVDKVMNAEERAKLSEERWERSVASFRAALEALRRTPFVPPTLRVSLGAVENYLSLENPVSDHRPASKSSRILLLDRDAPSLDRLAGELEEAGHEVLTAHYPEEVGFFLKTPDSRRLGVVVCDVMAFRPDQDLSAIFKIWRHDLPDLTLLLSFNAGNKSEAERAQRVPTVMAAGFIHRPLQRQALLEAIAAATKRKAGRS